MPFGGLHAVYPPPVHGVLDTWEPNDAVVSSSWASLLRGSWLKSHKATSFAIEPDIKHRHGKQFATNFGEAQITTCREGFRCVSRVNRFGTNHAGEVSRDNARRAQDAIKAKEEAMKDAAGGKDSQKVTGDDKNLEVEEYEWNCPVAQQWVPDKFESGVAANQCREEKDCVCIARGAEEGHVQMKDGIEKRHEMVEAEIGCAGGEAEKVPLIVIPHYPIRKIPDVFRPENINADTGEVTELPRDQWVNAYKNNAPKLQYALDEWRKSLRDTYNLKIADKPFVCGTPVPGQEASMNDQEVHDASVKIRRFQIYQQDCIDMRDTIPKLISTTDESVTPKGQEFAPSGHYKNRKLNCYNPANGDVCMQLNCYTGHDDTIFMDNLREFEAKMIECEPEPEDVGASKEAAIANSTAAAAKVPIPGDMPPTGMNPPKPEVTAGQAAQAQPLNGALNQPLAEGAPMPTGQPFPPYAETLPGNAPASGEGGAGAHPVAPAGISSDALTLLLLMQRTQQHVHKRVGQLKNDDLRDFL